MNTRIFLACVLAVLNHSAFAQAVGAANGTIPFFRIFTDGQGGQLRLNMPGEPPGTCNYYGANVKFEFSTANGKAMLAAIMTAKSTGTPVTVWYQYSSAPGSGTGAGCTVDTMAILQGISVGQAQ